MIDPDVTARITAALADIETDHDVRILYACESGSRAWGFASQDSDFDVRFIYLHPKPWYLSVDLERKRDVIELPIHDDLDVGGWELRKALRLFRKSNPPLLEWLGSPIVYLDRFSAAARMRALAPEFYSPVACTYHYLHMARGNFGEFLKGPEVRRKKYFYVLRPLLAIRWIEADCGVVPTEFSRLVERIIEAGPLRQAIEELIVEKAQGAELGKGPRIDAISEFIESELKRLEDSPFAANPPQAPVASLDRLFQELLAEAFGPD